jgi:hypothetical protein
MGTSLADRRTEIAAEIMRVESELVNAEAEAARSMEAIAGDVAVKTVTQEEGSKRRRRIERTVSAKRNRLAQLRDAAVEIERRTQEEAEQAHQTEVDRAVRQLDRAIKARFQAAKNLDRAVRVVEAAAAEVGRHRPLVDEAAESYRAVLRPDEPFRWPTNPDEPWTISEDTLAFLSDGPIQPLADVEETRRERENTQAEQDEETLASFVLNATEARLKTLSERLQPQARAILVEHRAKVEEQRRRQQAREAQRQLPRVGEERSRPPAPIFATSGSKIGLTCSSSIDRVRC